MSERHRNHGLRKRCDCPRKQWAKCAHSWYLNFKPRHGQPHRFSLDAELGRHVASKTEAEREAAAIRAAILAGTFKSRAEIAASPPPAPSPGAVTLNAFTEIYVERFCQPSGKVSWKDDQSVLNQLTAFVLPGPIGGPFGEKPLGAITEDDVEVFFAGLRQQGRAASTRNKYVQVIKAMFRWAMKKKYLNRNPIADSESIRREKPGRRARRLMPDVIDADGTIQQPGEERRLLAVAGALLQRLIIGALETACRRGELLKLMWADVDRHRRVLTVRAEHAKDRERRDLPISARLAAVLEMARVDQAGHDYPADAYVFGDHGRKVGSIKRAWETAVLKAHGHTPEWKGTKLSAASRAQLRAIDLHFHDLRHEAGSRLHEGGMPLHHVQEMLGHASLEQTTTYLNVTSAGLRESMRKLDDARKLCTTVAQEPPIDHRSVGNGDACEAAKELLH